VQPAGETLLQICCRWKHRQFAIQFSIAGGSNLEPRSLG
jgi:hypothetical protein